MAAKRTARMTAVIEELEGMVKALRADVRRAARQAGLTPRLERAARLLRKRAALVAAQVEKYAHEVRVELTRPARPVARRRATRRAA